MHESTSLYSRFPASVRDEIISRLRAGQELSCLGTDLPHRKVIASYRKIAHAFDAECQAAMASARKARGRVWKLALDGGPPLADEMRQTLLAHLRAGALISRLGPGFPSIGTIRFHRSADSAFDADVIAAMLAGNPHRSRPVRLSCVGARAAGTRKFYQRTPELRERIIAAVQAGANVYELGPDLPSAEVIKSWMKSDASFEAGIRTAARMPRKFLPSDRTPEMRVLVLTAIEAGASLDGLGDGLPTRDALRRWRRADTDFDAAVSDLTTATKNRDKRRFVATLTKPKVLAALASGRAVSKLGPGLPSQGTVDAWRRADPSFDRQVRELLGNLGRGYRSQMEAKARVLDELQEGAALDELGPSFPGAETIDFWRRSDPEFDRSVIDTLGDRSLHYGSRTQAKARTLVAVQNGANLHELGEGMPTAGAVNVWRKSDAAFDDAIRAIIVDRRVLKSSSKRRLARPASMPIQFQARQTNALYAAAHDAVSKSYPPDVRDDIITGTILAVLEGRFEIEGIKGAAKKSTTAYWRERDGFRQRSMDAPLSGDNARTLQNVLGGF